MMGKKGVSPVIATVLLIGMVIVIFLIVFLWFRGTLDPAIVKFDGENIELACENVALSAAYSPGVLTVSNEGSVVIASVKVEVSRAGSFETYDIKDLLSSSSEWKGLLLGRSFPADLKDSAINTGGELDGADELTIIPVLRGNSDEGEKDFVCDKRRFGKTIEVGP
jgi:flagellin-like protein